MIRYQSYDRDFLKIQNDVGKFMPDMIRDELENGISTKIKEIIVEYPYIDKDFRDTYYNDFSKRFDDICRDSIRLHLFFRKGIVNDKNYGGFLTLRDTKVFTIGRSYLHPKSLKNFKPGYFCLAEYQVQLKGIDLNVLAFPWMQQDGNVSICAHIAAWGVVRYFSQKYPYYPEKTLHEITVHDSPTRRVPSRGATVEQITQILQKNRFDPEVYIRAVNPDNDKDFDRLIYTFIESGIPYIAGLKERKHAVAVIGHGRISDTNKVFGENDGVVDSYELIEDIFLSDDNKLPYCKAYTYKNKDNINIDEIDVLIVPFYQKMYLDVNYLYGKLLPVIETNVLKFSNDETIIRRVFITSSRSFKRFVNNNCEDDIYKQIHLMLQMPKFIWVAEYSTVGEYNLGHISKRIIFDATMLQHQSGNFISLKNGNEVCINPRSATKNGPALKISSKEDFMYRNNLRRIK